MSKPATMSDFEREVLVILLKQACDSAADAETAVDRTVIAYLSLSEQLQALPHEKRLA